MKESEIRPADIFEEYLRLSKCDIKYYFAGDTRVPVHCPGCGLGDSNFVFKKYGFAYKQCNNCGSLFQSPRPEPKSFEYFYNDSKSSRYWAEVFSPSVAEARRNKIFKPRVKQLQQLCLDHKMIPNSLMDIGAGYGIFLEEWQKLVSKTKVIAVEPSACLAEICRNKGFEVIETIAEKVSGYDKKTDLVTCFEVLEHVYDPVVFIKTLAGFVKSSGAMLISTLCVDGFDIQVLWEKSNSISPPHHLNFMSVKGLKYLFKRAGMKNIKVFTPGVLDVDIVRNTYKKEPDILDGNRFIKTIINNDELCAKFQSFLTNNKLSSHAWVFAEKSNQVN